MNLYIKIAALHRNRTTPIQEIISEYCEKIELNLEEYKANKPRRGNNKWNNKTFVLYYVLKKYHKMGHSEIGKIVGVNHSTVINGLIKVESKIQNPKVKNLINKLLYA